MISIIDYDAGNIKSVEKALQYLGQDACITRDKEAILNSSHVILPGVGAFGDAMEKLNKYDLVSTIHEVVDNQIPFLGICLGLQLMFESSEESEGVKGLGLLPGRIVKFPEREGIKIPHMGWNSLSFPKESRLFAGMKDQIYCYFVHSYYLQAGNIEDVAATTEYITTVHAAVEKDNIFACQFHPEKSSQVGLKILQNFVSCKGGR